MSTYTSRQLYTPCLASLSVSLVSLSISRTRPPFNAYQVLTSSFGNVVCVRTCDLALIQPPRIVRLLDFVPLSLNSLNLRGRIILSKL